MALLTRSESFMHLNISNAYYSNRTMSFGLEFVSQSILWHEYGHGVTDFLDKLWYEGQSGALNEAWSDIFSGVIDVLTYQHAVRAEDVCPTDETSHRWVIGWDCKSWSCMSTTPSKTEFRGIRDMWQPECVLLKPSTGYPNKVSSMFCSANDNAGVHINSLIPSYAFTMLTDGSAKHGVTGVGLNASMKIFTRAKFLSTPMTTFALYASYLTTACEQLKNGDSSITASTCSSVAAAITATQMSGIMPCFSAEPSFLTDQNYPYTPLVFVKGAANSHFTLYVGGNFTGATLQWSDGSTGTCNMSSVRTMHLDNSANASNPIWAYQVQCPVPASLSTSEDVIISLGSSNTSQVMSMRMYWAATPVLDKAVLVASEGIDIYSQNLLPQAGNFMCELDVEHGFMVPCLLVFLCTQETTDPISKCGVVKDLAFSNDVPAVLRAAVRTEAFTRGKYYVYVSQHGRKPISNAASFTVKNADASLQICFDLKDVHVVVAEAVFGSVDADTDSSGCVTFDLEQGVEYTVSATKDNYLTQVWLQTLTKNTVSVHYTMVASAGQRVSAAAWLFMLCAVAVIRAL
eukprot:m51a1_g13032 hypothetical protein (573) ;mRNA; f:87-2204